ncbi:hypothetical protein PV11_08122 [Exophiala sideris]|uniref:Uncharacterized protein n=1 Tax=Exophiala sideris TaxID=1016849 RepID=A0A0D1YHX8_9EURO|nr:hypothetical protein PV11_08122 [Exophiala sideris]
MVCKGFFKHVNEDQVDAPPKRQENPCEEQLTKLSNQISFLVFNRTTDQVSVSPSPALMQMTQAIKLSNPWAKEQKFVNVSSYEAACTEREKVAGGSGRGDNGR